MQNFSIHKVYVEKDCQYLAYTRQILSRLPNAEVSVVPDIRAFLNLHPPDPDALDQGKRTLLLMNNRGRFFKPCPGTQKHLCCLYKVLHHAAGCTLDCSYCILQIYLNNPFIVYYVNVDDMLAELRRVFENTRKQIMRVGTGEFTDSLALEHITGTTHLLTPLLRDFPDVFLEVKTKTTNIDPIIGAEPRRQIIFAWSMNPDILIHSEEKGAALLDDRLRAAAKAQSLGYPVSFHFDPMLHFPGCEDAYLEVAEKLASAVDIERAFWISIGSFRFPPALKNVIEERFPENRLIYGEFIIGDDGKMRYFKPVRLEMYKKLVSRLKELAPRAFIYFCMEREDVWDEVFGFHPKNNRELKKMLDERCIKGREERP